MSYDPAELAQGVLEAFADASPSAHSYGYLDALHAMEALDRCEPARAPFYDEPAERARLRSRARQAAEDWMVPCEVCGSLKPALRPSGAEQRYCSERCRHEELRRRRGMRPLHEYRYRRPPPVPVALGREEHRWYDWALGRYVEGRRRFDEARHQWVVIEQRAA